MSMPITTPSTPTRPSPARNGFSGHHYLPFNTHHGLHHIHDPSRSKRRGSRVYQVRCRPSLALTRDGGINTPLTPPPLKTQEEAFCPPQPPPPLPFTNPLSLETETEFFFWLTTPPSLKRKTEGLVFPPPQPV